jgi:hypothetical protein
MPTKEPFEANLGVLARVHVANCAAERARMYCTDTERFNGEFDTALMWTNYKCFISNYGSYVETY